MVRLTRSLIVVLGLSLCYHSAMAICLDGRHPTVNDEFGESAFVGVGVVTGHKEFSSPDDPEGVEKTLYDFKVSRRFKGGMRSAIRIQSDNTSSRFPMEVGKSYLVFLRTADKELFVDACGNSGELRLRTAAIAQLKKRRPCK